MDDAFSRRRIGRPIRFLPRIARSTIGLLAIALGAAWTVGCGGQPARPRNVLLVTLDTMRADYVGAYPGSKAVTPNLDALAARSLLFENAWSLIPITLPAHASIFYSQPPHDIRNYNNGQPVRSQRARPALANLFRKAGFATAAFVSLGVLGRDFGLDEGFLEYADDFPADRWYLTAAEVNARVLPWLEAHRGRPFFAWVHYSDPHDPYAPPDTPDDLRLFLNDRPLGSFSLGRYLTIELDLELRAGLNRLRFDVTNPHQPNPDQFMARLDLVEATPADGSAVTAEFHHGWFIRREDGIHFLKNGAAMDLRTGAAPGRVRLRIRGKPLVPPETIRRVMPDLYRAEVEYLDREIGRLRAVLEETGLARDTAILVVGDHGEGLGEYDNDLGDAHIGHIHYLQPAYLKVPLFLHVPGAAAARRVEAATLLDVAPTIAALMGLDAPSSFRGRNLLRLEPGAAEPVFSYTFRPEAFRNRFGLLETDRLLIFSPETGRYDLYDLASDPGARANLRGGPGAGGKDMERRLNEFARGVLQDKIEIAIDSKAEEMLRSLGYIKN